MRSDEICLPWSIQCPEYVQQNLATLSQWAAMMTFSAPPAWKWRRYYTSSKAVVTPLLPQDNCKELRCNLAISGPASRVIHNGYLLLAVRSSWKMFQCFSYFLCGRGHTLKWFRVIGIVLVFCMKYKCMLDVETTKKKKKQPISLLQLFHCDRRQSPGHFYFVTLRFVTVLYFWHSPPLPATINHISNKSLFVYNTFYSWGGGGQV